ARENHRLAQSGGAFAARRDALAAEREQLGQAIGEAEAEVRALCEGLLPFALAAGLCRKLRAQLISERAVLRWEAHEAALRDRLAQAKAGLAAAMFPPGQPPKLSPADQTALRGRT